MKQQGSDIRIIISGGGTGGHVFPAIAIADALKARLERLELLFVGADNRLEMEKVPEAGYRIRGLPIRGFIRKITLKNISVIIRLFKSLRIARKIIQEFQPDAVVGVGGYASGPVLRIASRSGIPTLIQEQNSYAGMTNKLLSSRVNKICVAYSGMERYFPGEKIILTGNPVRKEIQQADLGKRKEESIDYFSLDSEKKVILVLGGSLGARSINNSIMSKLDLLIQAEIQLLWQCGKTYYTNLEKFLESAGSRNIRLLGFIKKMDLAYAAADLIISRAGALTVSELCHVGKPVILVPSPNVAEDHQTRNAMALAEKEAAVCIADHEVEDRMISEAMSILKDPERSRLLSERIAALAARDSAMHIADEIIKMLE